MGYNKHHQFSISDMYCEKCGFHTTVPRSVGKQREKGHLKTMWCPRCQQKTEFREVRAFDFAEPMISR